MKIIICTKAVPGFITRPVVSELNDRIDYEAGSIVINESDDYALEAGIALAKKSGGTATVVTVGSLSSQKVLQTGLGKDADGAIRVDASLYEPASTARLLATAIKELDFDLIITGVESSDLMASQVGVSIAEMLDLPFSFAVTDMMPGEKADTIKITKELGLGKVQIEEITLPMVVCFQTGTEPPSFVPVRKLMLAQRKPIKTITLKDMAIESIQPTIKVLEIVPPKQSAYAKILEGDPSSQASVIMQKIKEAVS